MIYEFQATQDLHGYDKPWAPGTGKNLLNPDPDAWKTRAPVSYLYIQDVVPENEIAIMSFHDKNPSVSIDDIYFGFTGADLDVVTDVNPFAWGINKGRASTINNTKQIEGETVYLTEVMMFPKTDEAFDAVFSRYNVLVELGSTPTAFEPYSNICMPEGFNIWDPDNAEFVQVYAGYVNANTRELYLRPVYEEYAGEELVGPWMSSLDPYAEDTTPTEGAFVIDFGGELESFEITPFMLQTLLDSLGIRQHFTDGAGLLNKLMDQAQGRVRSEEELLHLSRPLNVIAIGDQLPSGITFKPISKDVLPGLPGKFIR